MTIVRTDIDLDAIVFAKGAHSGPDDGGCVMEWAAYLAGEKWSDAPDCVAPSIRSFCIGWNDALPDADRTRLLRPYLTKVIGTNTHNADDELARFWLLADWTVRTSTPTWLRLAGLTEDADALAGLPELRTPADLAAAQPLLDAARDHARAAWDAARDAVWAVARDAVWAVAWDAARDAVWAVARDAAWAVARAAPRAVAWAAARAALAPTVAGLQASACGLLDRLCEVGRG